MSSRTSWLLGGTLITALGALSMGCGGGVGPGDYVIYRVAVSKDHQGSSCVGADDPSNKSDSSTFLTSGDYFLYAGLEDTFYLDTGARTLEGTLTDDSYAFTGKEVDINYTAVGAGSDMKETLTITANVTMTVDGEAATGTGTLKTSYKCEGNTICGEDTSCTVSADFVGTEVDDVQIYHDI